MNNTKIASATSSASVADILERVLDKGVVIAGDIRVKLVDIELLSIQIRLVVCSIDKAKEIGMDWWNTTLDKSVRVEDQTAANDGALLASRLESLESRLRTFEAALVEK